MKLPLCAICGCSLAQPGYRRLRVTVQYDGLPGRPIIGWCEDHYPGPDLPRGDPRTLLGEVEARGPGRVVAGKRWRSTARG